VLAISLAPVPAAFGASATFSSTTLTITGESTAETIGISQAGDTITVTAPSFGSDPDGGGTDCARPDATTVTCADSAVFTLVVDGGAGADTITDTRAASFDTEDLRGGADGDTITFAPAAPTIAFVTLSGGDGNDTLTKNSFSVTATGGPDDDTLNAGSGQLSIQDTGGPGNDTFVGGPSTDFFVAEEGGDSYTGGAGGDSLSYGARSTDITVTFDGQANDGSPGENDNVQSVDAVGGGQGVNRMTAGSEPAILAGGPAADVLAGGPADDVLSGTGGDDQLDGAGGNDALDGGDANDALVGGDGEDELRGDAGDDTLRSDDGAPGDHDNCGDGNDVAFAERFDGVSATCESVTLVKPAGPTVGIARTGTVKGRNARLDLSCPGTAPGPCKGTLALRRKGKKIASTRFEITSGASERVKLKLTKAAARRVKRSGKLTASAKATATAAGTAPAVTNATVKLAKA
jgi:Ca2+-binding RTX toxin-like protein